MRVAHVAVGDEIQDTIMLPACHGSFSTALGVLAREIDCLIGMID